MTALQQVSSMVTLYPAYNRTYSSSNAALEDWRQGKDFKVGLRGPYCSIRDLEYLCSNSSSVWIAWNKVDTVRI